MTEQKAFWHALMTVGIAALLVAGFLLYVAGPHSENWPAFALITLMPALAMLPLVYRKYLNGPPPPLTRRQHLSRAALFGLLSCIYTLGILMERNTGWKLFSQWCTAGGYLLISLDYLRRAYKKKEENPSATQ